MAQVTLDTNTARHAVIEARLKQDIVIWLCSVRPDGRPHAALVWFLWDDNSVLVFSKPNQQKLRNIESNPKVLLVIDDSKGGEEPITIDGTAEILNDSSLSTTLPRYAEKYARNLEEMGWTDESMSKEYTVAVRITPTRFR